MWLHENGIFQKRRRYDDALNKKRITKWKKKIVNFSL